MYAVIATGGQQFRVSEGDTLVVKRLNAEVGGEITLDQVLMVGGEGAELKVGTPVVLGASVTAQVVEHGRGVKRDIYKYRARKRYRKGGSFRPSETTLAITGINA